MLLSIIIFFDKRTNSIDNNMNIPSLKKSMKHHCQQSCHHKITKSETNPSQ